MRFLQRSDSSRSNTSKTKRSNLTKFFSNLSLSSRASRPDRPTSVTGFGTYPAGRQSEQLDRGTKGEHGLLSRASFDALSSKFSRSRKASFGAASVLDSTMLGPVVDIGHELERPHTPVNETSPVYTHANSLFGLTPIRDIATPAGDSPYSLMHLSATSSTPPSPSPSPSPAPQSWRRSSAPSPDSRPSRRRTSAGSAGQMSLMIQADERETSGNESLALGQPMKPTNEDLDGEGSSQNEHELGGSEPSYPSDASSTHGLAQCDISQISHSASLSQSELPFGPSAASDSISVPKTRALPPSTSMTVIPAWLLEDSFDHLFRNSPPSSPQRAVPSSSPSPSPASEALCTADWQQQFLTSPGGPADYSTSSVQSTPSPEPEASPPRAEAEIVTAHRKKLVKRKAVPLVELRSPRGSKVSKESYADSTDLRTPETPHFEDLRHSAVPLESNTLGANGSIRLVSKYQPADSQDGLPTPDFASVFEQGIHEAEPGLECEIEDEDEWDGTYEGNDIGFDGRSEDDADDSFAREFSINSLADTTLSNLSGSSFTSRGTTIVHSTPDYRRVRQSIGGAIDRLLEDVEEWTMGTAIRVSPPRLYHQDEQDEDLFVAEIGQPSRPARLEELRCSQVKAERSFTPSSVSSFGATDSDNDGNRSGIRQILNRKLSISSAELTEEAKQMMEKTREERRARRDRPNNSVPTA